MLLSLVYVSAATRSFDQRDLAELLQTSRRNNAALGVTGLLLHVGGNFMQALEGDDEQVDALYRKISADPRHARIVTILRQPIDERVFADWAMGFREVGSLPPEIRAQVSTYMADANHRDTEASPQKLTPTLALLRGFAMTMR